MAKNGKNNIEKEDSKSKKNIWERFMTFCHGVVVESKRVHWTTKGDLIKYFVSTLVFVMFFSLFFYLVDFIYAFIHSLV